MFFKTGPLTAHAALNIMAGLNTLNPTWTERGYTLKAQGNTWDVTGDTTQFYLDAMANDAHAAFAMAFLARFNPTAYAQYCEDAAEDLIDMDDSLGVYLHNMPLEDAMRAQNLL